MDSSTAKTVGNAVHDLANSLTTKTGSSMPTFTTIGLACLIPTLAAGLYKREYTVSYGYGAAVATSAGLILRSLLWPNDVSTVPMNSLAALHAFILLFYGVRLDLFLFLRQTLFPKFASMRAKDTQKPVSNDMIKRIPFIVGCSFLYFCLVAPVLITSSSTMMQSTKFNTVFKGVTFKDFAMTSRAVAASFLTVSLVSFLVAALGDLQKSWVKSKHGKDGKEGQHVLVTSGIYRFLRHPNYTGEIFGWSCSCLAALTTLAFSKHNHMKLNWINGGLAVASVLGVVGMLQVLTMATSRLEKQQAEKYGEQPEYNDWMKRSWVGFTAPSKSKSKST